MLYLTRKVGEGVVINDHIHVEVVEVRGKSVKLGIKFPPDVRVLRREVHEKVHAANAGARAEADILSDFLKNDM